MDSTEKVIVAAVIGGGLLYLAGRRGMFGGGAGRGYARAAYTGGGQLVQAGYAGPTYSAGGQLINQAGNALRNANFNTGAPTNQTGLQNANATTTAASPGNTGLQNANFTSPTQATGNTGLQDANFTSPANTNTNTQATQTA